MDNDTQKWARLAGLNSDPVRVESYRSEEFFKLERDRVFARSWLIMGRQEELPKPHSFIVKEIEICGVSVLITRAADGKVRAFHNVCSHRGNQVVVEREGCRPILSCRYHGWSYASDGTLRGVPDEQCFSEFDKSANSLTPIATEVWNGWIFINLEREPSVSLKDFLGDMGPFLDSIEYPNAATPVIVEARLQCNWKVVSDAFSEAYHIPMIHPETIGATFSSSENRTGRLLDARFFGPHRFCSMYGNPGYQPLEQQLVEKFAYGSVQTGSVIAAGQVGDTQRFLSHPSINPTRSASWSMDVNAVFPNFHLDTGPGGFWTHHFWPLTYNTTRHEVRFYVPQATTVRERFQQEHYLSRVVEVLAEDLSNVARVQRGLESGGKDKMNLQDNEILIRHSVHHIEKWARSTTVTEAMNA